MRSARRSGSFWHLLPAWRMPKAWSRSSSSTQGGARHAFQVEVARNDADRAQGLMFRRSMPADRGMLFDFRRVEPVAMWMQNTYLSLDMLFIRPDGTIARVASDTEPFRPARSPPANPSSVFSNSMPAQLPGLGSRPATGSSTRSLSDERLPSVRFA